MYKGYTEINLTDKELARFYEGKDMEFCFSENEQVALYKTKDSSKNSRMWYIIKIFMV